MPLLIVAALAATIGFPAAAVAQDTRAELLERLRAEKASQLKPYEAGRLERWVMRAEDGRLRRLITPHNGFFVSLGYTHKPVGAGIGFGGGFRHDLFDRRARIELGAGSSFGNYQMVRADFSLPRLFDERLELGVEALYRRHPQEDFYGPGPDSSEADRVSYLFKGRELQGRAIVAVAPWLRVGTLVGHLAPSIGAGTDARFPTLEAGFDQRAAPGIFEQPSYAYGEAFADVDYRDEPGNARAGGRYRVGLRKYGDRDLDRYGFRSLDLLFQQFVPLFDKKRVFAFQAAVVGTSAEEGHQVPFYMQPTVGGSRTLRSVADYRFRDTHAMWLNAEYRWEVFSALDMALFTDWGQVAPGGSELSLSNLTPAYGIGFRFNTAQAVFFRVDVATGGGEGLQLFVNFNRAF